MTTTRRSFLGALALSPLAALVARTHAKPVLVTPPSIPSFAAIRHRPYTDREIKTTWIGIRSFDFVQPGESITIKTSTYRPFRPCDLFVPATLPDFRIERIQFDGVDAIVRPMMSSECDPSSTYERNAVFRKMNRHRDAWLIVVQRSIDMTITNTTSRPMFFCASIVGWSGSILT